MSNQDELAEAFAEAYSRARYGWSLAQYDATKQRLVRAEAAGLMALAQSGRMHAVAAALATPALTTENVMDILDATVNAGWNETSTYEMKRQRAEAVLARINAQPGLLATGKPR